MRSACVRCGRLGLGLLCGAPNDEWSCQQQHKRNRFAQNLLSLQYKIHRKLLVITLFKTCDRIERNVSAPANFRPPQNGPGCAARSNAANVQTATDGRRRNPKSTLKYGPALQPPAIYSTFGGSASQIQGSVGILSPPTGQVKKNSAGAVLL